ncbi:MAG TPA: hypothetical protein DDZ80_03720, partial [Cyanobacteria bacterium UBA8803]|nr:hypothetical protein [Cyanobacteria bacterium UBA8803]
MRTRHRIRKKASWEPDSTPAPNQLQTRPFGKGIQARKAELPANNLLQMRPFASPNPASSEQQEMPDIQTQLEQAQRFGYNAANIPVFAPSTAPPIQAKLTIGQVGDKYEQEADQVAAQVVNQIHAPQTQQPAQGQTVQRETAPQEEEEDKLVQQKPLTDAIQRETVP